MKKMTVLLLGLLITFASGCATLPSPDVMRTEIMNYQLPQLPEEGKALVYVVRPEFAGGIVRFNVFVDDQEAESEMGYTRNQQYIYFNLMPGSHKIYSKAENWAEVDVDVKPGEIIFIKQEVKMGIIMARNALSIIEEDEGKYHVKTLKKGEIIKTDK